MIQTYIPFGKIPTTPKAGTQFLQWFSTDSEENYHLNPHPCLGPNDVSYSFNPAGYRCEGFDCRKDLVVVSVGCSWTQGIGVPWEHTYPEVFCQQLRRHTEKSVTNWNMGFEAKSNDYIARTLLCVLPILKPDVALVTFTYPNRREYVSVDGEMIDLLASHVKSRNRKHRDILQHLLALASHHEDLLNMYKNYKLAEFALNQAGTKWLFSAVRVDQFAPIVNLLDSRRFVEVGIPRLDNARDSIHPGVRSMQAYARSLFSRFLEVYS